MALPITVSEITTICNLAWKIYKLCQDASGSFKNVSSEVLSLHAVLRQAEESLSEMSLSDSRLAGLTTVIIGCRDVLGDLEALVEKYKRLGGKTQRVWDRVGWHTEDIAELRLRLVSNIGLLSAFISSSQIAVEQKLDKLVKDFKNGYHEASIITTKTIDSITTDDKQKWTTVRKELEEIGISLEAFELNKPFIMKWFRDALERGDFEEQQDDVDSGNEIFRDDSEIEVDEKVGQEHPIQKISTKIEHVEMPNPRNKTSRVVKTSQSGDSPQAAGPRRRGNRLGRLVHRLLGYDNALYQACESGNVAKVRELLEKGADPNSTKEGRSAIFVAIKTKRAAIIKLLIEKGADYKTTFFQDEYGSRMTLLGEAVVDGDLETVELLLKLKADIEAAPGGGRTDNPSPLELASSGYIEKMHLLLSHGADVNSGNNGLSPLREAISTGSLQAVKLLLEKGADMHRPLVRQGEQMSALRFAVLNRLDDEIGRFRLEGRDRKYLEIVEILLQKGANPNEPSLMSCVVRDQDVNLAKLLIEYGA